MLSLSLAVKLIGFLLQGDDKLSEDARLSILQDPIAVSSLLDSLASVKNVVAARIAHDSNDDNNNNNNRSSSVLVETIEVYGRLLMHQCVVCADKEGEALEEDAADGSDASKTKKAKKKSKSKTTALRLSDDMLELLRWLRDDVLPATAASGATGGGDSVSDVADSAALPMSPPAKLKRPAGTTPGKALAAEGTSAASSASASSSSSSSSSSNNSQEQQALAATVAGRVLTLASDWAHCCAGLPDLSAANVDFVEMVMERGSNGDESSSNAAGDLQLSPLEYSGLVLPLCRLTYQLAFREPQGATLSKSALKMILRAAHLGGGGGGDDDDDDEVENENEAGEEEGGVNGSACSPLKTAKKLLALAAGRSRGALSTVSGVVAEFLLQQVAEQARGFTSGLQLEHRSGKAALALILRQSGDAAAQEFVGHLLGAAKWLQPPLSLAPPPPSSSSSSEEGSEVAEADSLEAWLAKPAIVLLRAVCVAEGVPAPLLARIWAEASACFPADAPQGELQAVGALFNSAPPAQSGVTAE